MPVWKYRLEGATSFLGISPGNAEQRLVSSDQLQLPSATNKAEAPSVAHLLVFKVSCIATTECEFTLQWWDGQLAFISFPQESVGLWKLVKKCVPYQPMRREPPPGNPPVEYTVQLQAPQTQMVEIQMVIRNVFGNELEVALPVWRPGRYDVLNPSGTVRNVSASTPSGTSLSVTKIDKTTWRIRTEGENEVRVTYSIYANSLGNRTRHVDDTHAFLSGATVFFYVPERRKDWALVHIDAPADWKVATGLEPVDGNPRTRFAPDYDVLVDSPLEIGLHDVIPFDVDEVPHEIVIWGDIKYDAGRLIADFTRIVKEGIAIFGDMPYKRYVFLVHVSPDARGGTEHLNSTIMQTTRRSFETEAGYKAFLGLVSHEMFHTWNVKQFRPAGIHPYDYTKENYTDLLWVAEGATSYYDDLILVRCGLESADAYLALLGRAIESQRNRPGSRVQSLAESSFDAWVKFNHPTPDDVNSTISFYEAGAMASLLLDMELRTRTDNRVSLDDAMRKLYVRFPLSGSGYTMEDLVGILDRMSESSFRTFFESFITGAGVYPFEDALRVVGLEVLFHPESKPYAGLHLHDRSGVLEVRSVLSDGPACLAGVNAGDEIVALDGKRVTADEFEEYIAVLNTGDVIQLHIVRRGRLRTFEVKVRGRSAGRCQLARVKSPTEAQKAAYRSWLHQFW